MAGVGESGPGRPQLHGQMMFNYVGMSPVELRNGNREPEAVMKFVPSQLLNPDGTISVGVPVRRDNKGIESSNGGTSSLPTGYFLVMNGPEGGTLPVTIYPPPRTTIPPSKVVGTQERQRRQRMQILVGSLQIVDAILLLASLIIVVASKDTPHVTSAALHFALGVIYDAVGVYGTYTENLTILVMYGLCVMLDFFVGITALASLLMVPRYCIALLAAYTSRLLYIRLSHRWFPPSRP